MSRKFFCPYYDPDIVVLDNLGSHRCKAVHQLIRSVDAKLFFLPKYSPDLNPIEQALPSSSICSAKPPRGPSTQSAPQSAAHSMPSPQMNAPTTSKIQAIGLNAIML
jgi:hypothetical protein